jgi:putative addiction module component (TIGR02574 family)
MTVTDEEIERMALALEPQSRAQLVSKLWESLDDMPCPELSDEWKEEISRRCHEIDQGKARMIPGEQVMREAYGSLQAVPRP